MSSYVNELGLAENSMPISSDLVFYHSLIPAPLRIRSGANSIKWSYDLNTTTTPTVGGEVVQILSCFVGPITIEGMAAGYQTGPTVDRKLRPGWRGFTPTDEVMEIVRWFRTYMHYAGTKTDALEKRTEAAIRFEYPARGWSFYIQVTALNGFDFSVDQVGVPWSITAEIVSDAALDYFEQATLNTFTDSLTQRTALHRTISLGKDAASNPFLNPALNDPGASELAGRLGDNFQSLVASWAGSNFMTWGFNPLGDPGDVLASDPYSEWFKLLGGHYLGQFTDEEIADYQGAPFVASDAGADATGSLVVGGVSSAEPWISLFLNKLGAPGSQQNICFMQVWQSKEGGHTHNPCDYNYLNHRFENQAGAKRAPTTDPATGKTYSGWSQFASYDTMEHGIDGLVQFLRKPHYKAIVDGLMEGNPINYPGVRDALTSKDGSPGWNASSDYGPAIFTAATACVKKAQAASSSSKGIFKVTGPTSPGDPYWGGAREIAERLLGVYKANGGTSNAPLLPAAAGGSGTGAKDRGAGPTLGNSYSDHDRGMTVGYALDCYGDMDRAAKALAVACGKPWPFTDPNDWFDIPNANGYRIQIGWKVPDHYDHVHIGVRKV